MQFGKMALMSTVAALFSVSGAMGAPVMIDSFDTNQNVNVTGDPPSAVGNEVEENAGTILGGHRDVEAMTTGGSSQTFLDVVVDGTGTPGEYSHSQGSDVTGQSKVQWDGNDQDTGSLPGISLDPTGLGSIDLTDGGFNDYIAVGIVQSDYAADITFTVFSGESNSSSLTKSTGGGIPGGAPLVEMLFDFGDFDAASGSGADFGAVSAIEMLVDAPFQATDLRLDYVKASSANPIPAPAALPAGLALLSGMGVFRLRSRRRA